MTVITNFSDVEETDEYFKYGNMEFSKEGMPKQCQIFIRALSFRIEELKDNLRSIIEENEDEWDD